MRKLLGMRIEFQRPIVAGAKPNVALMVFYEVINSGRGIEEVFTEIPLVKDLTILILADEIVLSYPKIALVVAIDARSIGEWLLQVF